METNNSDPEIPKAQNSNGRFSKAAMNECASQLWKKVWQTTLRCIGILAFFTVCLIILWGFLTLEENIRGKCAWNKYKNELIAEGKWFGDDRPIPPNVLDSENFAMTPCLAGLFAYGNSVNQSAYDAASIKKTDPSWNELKRWSFGKEIDFGRLLQNLHKTNALTLPQSRAEASVMFMKDLEENEVKLREIEQALSRPYSRFNLDYKGKNKGEILVPHLLYLSQFASAFAFKSAAQLAQGQMEKALKNLEISFRLENTISNEPFIVSRYTQMSMFENSCQPLWEGLVRHQWSDEQLQAIQKRLDHIDFFSSMNATISTDFDFLMPSLFDLIRDDANQGLNYILNIHSEKWSSESLDFYWYKFLVPRGWTYLDQVNAQRIHEKYATCAFDISKRLVSPTKERQGLKSLESEIGRNPLLQHTYICKMYFNRGFNFNERTAYFQTLVDEAKIACALERFRSANGHYPEKLNDLTPQYMTKIPHDIINGEPLKYKRDVGHYIIYSVGWDEKDNNGLQTDMILHPVAGKDFQMQTNFCDWVWSSKISKD